MPSVVDISSSRVSFKEQAESKDDCGDGGAGDGRHGSAELETTPEASLKSPVTPAPAFEPDGTPALRWKSYSVSQREPSGNGHGTRVAYGKGKLVINLSGIPRSLMKVEFSSEGKASPVAAQGQVMVAIETSPVESAGASLERNGSANQKTSEDMATISERAKKVRLRVKRVRLSAKPNLFQRRDADSEAKEKTSEAKENLCKVEPAAEQKTCAEVPDDEIVSGRILNRVHEPLPVDTLHTPSCSLVAEDRCGRDGVEDGEIDTSKGFDVHSVTVDSGADLVPLGSSIAAESVNISHAADACGAPNREYSIGQTAALEHRHGPFLKGASREGVSKLITKGPVDYSCAEGQPTENRGRSHEDLEILSRVYSWKEHTEYCTHGRLPVRARSMSVSVQDGSVVSETSRLDVREHTILETLLPDEPPGFSVDRG